MLQNSSISKWFVVVAFFVASVADAKVDFNSQIRPLLSNRCFACHGPDGEDRKAGLRLDTKEGAMEDGALMPGKPNSSELFRRITTSDKDDIMPPPDKGEAFTSEEVALIRRWIEEGGDYAVHWSYALPKKADLPVVKNKEWPINEIDRFLLSRMEKEELSPTSAANKETLARRIALDLTGLPPSLDELNGFLGDKDPGAYERYVDLMLSKPAFGEHWARPWLDQARYADSSGYPSDQPREIWGYRDWVIQALNQNMPFDQFTVEQIAGDLLPNATKDQIIATAFHRNTMTQNEGGTSDEEFRTAAVVDRVNTTMEVWMGTTMACAQCHTHKYDPILQEEYFKVFAILNQTEDADRKDESPLIEFFTNTENSKRETLQSEINRLENRFKKPKPAELAGLSGWEKALPLNAKWLTPKPALVRSSSKSETSIHEDARVTIGAAKGGKDTLTVSLPVQKGKVEAVRLEALADDALPGKGPGRSGSGNFVLSQVTAEYVPDGAKALKGRRLRVTARSEKYHFLGLAEVLVFSGGVNIAKRGKASQLSSFQNGEAKRAIDGNTDGNSAKGKSVAITGGGTDPQWWELTFDKDQSVDRVLLWKRMDKGQGNYLIDLELTLFDAEGNTVWTERRKKTFGAREEFSLNGRKGIRFSDAFADATQAGFNARDVLAERPAADKGWAMANFTGKDRVLTLIADKGFQIDEPGQIVVRLLQTSKWANHTLGSLRLGVSSEPHIRKLAGIPSNVLSALSVSADKRSKPQKHTISDYYARQVAPALAEERRRLASVKKQLAAIKPATVPIMRELKQDKMRLTKIQRRGNWQDLGDQVEAGVPEAFHDLPGDRPADRLALARWLISRENTLTARVTVNRFWEKIFGIGIVRSTEEFGSQGELPTHPELLDWLAVDFMEHGWNVKRLLRQFVMSRAYRQDSLCSHTHQERDPENLLLARGPRHRPTGEQIRDQSLYVAGLLSEKTGGPSVRPRAPNLGLKTAFGRNNDWATSAGEDQYRRSIYTEVRRNAPYASFQAFDAPNREVCTIRRNRSNTPLQAFVTLNDPVYVEASQALARRIVNEASAASTESRLDQAFEICLSRQPDSHERKTLAALYEDALKIYQADTVAAAKLASDPLPAPDKNANIPELAAWTTLANVIINLDEFLMRR